MNPDQVVISDDGILFKEYPFAPSAACQGRIRAADIRAVALFDTPPNLQVGQELIFVPAALKPELQAFALRNQLFLTQAFDIWENLLEPFLDTEFSQERQQQTLASLEEHGVSRAEAEALREKVADAMYLYNFGTMLWDWVYLGLYDLLHAMQQELPPEGFAGFYWEAMEIALRPRR